MLGQDSVFTCERGLFDTRETAGEDTAGNLRGL